MPPPYHPRPPRVPPVVMPPRPQRPRMRDVVRREYLLVPIVLVAAVWFISGAETPALRFDEVARFLGARDITAYRELTTLGIVCVGFVWITKIWRRP